MADIKFGTDGWRAVVGKDFNEENVGIVSKARLSRTGETRKTEKITAHFG